MIGKILAFLDAGPKILAAIERLADAQTVQAAQQRREQKDELLEDLIARARAARDERVREREISGDGAADRSQP